MRKTILPALLMTVIAAPVIAAGSYPVSGQWGESKSSEKGPGDCNGVRVIGFNGDTRTDSKGGVPAYRIKSIDAESGSRYRVVDQFTSGQIRNGSVKYTLHQVDDDHLELNMQMGGMLKLRKCK